MTVRVCRAGGPHRHQGVALITALLVTAFVVILSVSMIDSQQLDIRRTGNILFRDQAYVYATGLESLTYEMLKQDGAQQDHYADTWACEGLQIPFQNGQLLPFIEDLQARFNINNLVQQGKHSPNDMRRFQNLLEIIRQDAMKAPESADDEALMTLLQDMNAADLTNAVVDFIDADGEALPGGGEDSVYQNAERPHRTANRPMASTSELLLVKGFHPRLFKLVEPHVTALPVYTRINAHTATTSVLRALAEEIDCIDADKLQRPARRVLTGCFPPATQEGEETFSNADEFLKHDAFAGCKLIGKLGKQQNPQDDQQQGQAGENDQNQQGNQPPANQADPNTQTAADVISVNSEFFMLRSRSELGTDEQTVGVSLFSVIQRKDGKLVTISRSQGVY